MGYRAGVSSATEETPAAQVANWTVIGPPDHLPALKTFAESSRGGDRRVRERVGTGPALAGSHGAWCVRDGGPSGSARTGCARSASWPGTRFLTPPGGRSAATTSLTTAVRDLGLPLILKTAASGYDGKGQVLVEPARRRDRCLGQPGPGAVRGRGMGRLCRGGFGRRGPRRRRSGRLLSGRAQPPRAPHPGLDAHARAGGAGRRPGIARAGPGRGPGAGDRRRLDRRVLLDGRRPAHGQRDRPAPPQFGALDDRGGRHEPV